MKKIAIQDCVCTIEQGKHLDELLGRTGQYGDNLFHHAVFYRNDTEDYRILFCGADNILYKAEIVCNAYCDAELDQLLPDNQFPYNDKVCSIDHWRVCENFYSDIRSVTSYERWLSHTGMPTSAQSKAQCLIWLIENTGYKPQNQ